VRRASSALARARSSRALGGRSPRATPEKKCSGRAFSCQTRVVSERDVGARRRRRDDARWRKDVKTMCATREAIGRCGRGVGVRRAGWSTRAPSSRRRRDADETEAPAEAEARFERTVDDVERRFRAMRERMGWWGGEVGIAAHAREGIRAALERALAASATGRATRPPEESSEEEPMGRTRRRKLSSKSGQRMLRQWILDHFDAPFPNRAEKERLAEQLDWSVACVSNFFINARQRFFKPLVLDLARELELEKEARERAGTAAPSVTASTETYSRKRARY
jgi:hypothetical protein